MLNIHTIEFEIAAAKADQARPNNLPQIAVAGRSNVGKSSFLNAIARRKGLAKTSSTPGRTRQIVLFRVNDAFYFADLPGYGYAKVAQSVKKEWGREIERYLGENDALKGVILLFDSRRDLREEDFGLLHWLSERSLPVIPVVTKMDKFAKNQAKQRLDAWARSLEKLTSLPPLGFSALANEGRGPVLGAMERCLRGELEAAPPDRFNQIAG